MCPPGVVTAQCVLSNSGLRTVTCPGETGTVPARGVPNLFAAACLVTPSWLPIAVQACPPARASVTEARWMLLVSLVRAASTESRVNGSEAASTAAAKSVNEGWPWSMEVASVGVVMGGHGAGQGSSCNQAIFTLAHASSRIDWRG